MRGTRFLKIHSGSFMEKRLLGSKEQGQGRKVLQYSR